MENTHTLVEAAILRPSPVAPETVDGAEALDRHTIDAELSLGEIDEHLAALRRISADVLGHEYETAQQIADDIDDAVSRFEGLL